VKITLHNDEYIYVVLTAKRVSIVENNQFSLSKRLRLKAVSDCDKTMNITNQVLPALSLSPNALNDPSDL